jgi:hypothetical protein
MRKWARLLLIGLSTLGAVLGALLVYIGFCVHFYEPSGRNAQTEARIIRTAIQQWQAANNQTSCPTIELLVADKQLDPGRPPHDPWDRPYRLLCTADEVMVRSSGPDGQLGTADDVAVPREQSGR